MCASPELSTGPHSTSSSSGTFYFLRLPPEIRLHVYKHLLSSCYRLRPYISPTCKFDNSILLANRQIYQESVDVLYGTSRFEIVIVCEDGWMKSSDWDERREVWIHRSLDDPGFLLGIGKRNSGRIKRLGVEVIINGQNQPPYHQRQIAQIDEICSIVEGGEGLKNFQVTFTHSRKGHHWGAGPGNPRKVYAAILERLAAHHAFEQGEIYVSTTEDLFAIAEDLLYKLKGVKIGTPDSKRRDEGAGVVLDSEDGNLPLRHGGRWIVTRSGGWDSETSKRSPDIIL